MSDDGRGNSVEVVDDKKDSPKNSKDGAVNRSPRSGPRDEYALNNICYDTDVRKL